MATSSAVQKPKEPIFYKGKNLTRYSQAELIELIRDMLRLDPGAARGYQELMSLASLSEVRKGTFTDEEDPTYE